MCGILSEMFLWIVAGVGLVLGIIGVVLSAVALYKAEHLREGGKALATTGLALSITGVNVCLFNMFLAAVLAKLAGLY